MVARILPYANPLISPSCGKVEALAFVEFLLFETHYRFIEKRTEYYFPLFSPMHTRGALSLTKSIQIVLSVMASPLTPQIKVQAMLMTILFQSFRQLDQDSVQRTVLNKISPRGWQINLLSMDFFLACALEVANIAAKVMQSLAVGAVVQKTCTGQTEGKIQLIVSSALLFLSAANVLSFK